MNNRNTFFSALAALEARITDACGRAGRPRAGVVLLPVTKNHPAEAVAWVAEAGLPAVGENRVQEVRDKQALVGAAIRWELIGHLQSNKVNQAVGLFDRIQSVDSVRLGQKIARGAEELGKAPFPVLLQVNAGHDPAKSGFEPAEIEACFGALVADGRLRIDGLMTIAPLAGGREAARETFRHLRLIRDRLAKAHGAALPELSMGMSGDLEEAVAEGATILRVGTALLGER